MKSTSTGSAAGILTALQFGFGNSVDIALRASLRRDFPKLVLMNLSMDSGMSLTSASWSGYGKSISSSGSESESSYLPRLGDGGELSSSQLGAGG